MAGPSAPHGSARRNQRLVGQPAVEPRPIEQSRHDPFKPRIRDPPNARPQRNPAQVAEKTPPIPAGPLHIIVSIDKQRATLFADGTPVASTAISSGTASHPTPMGVFSVLQKNRHHVSNLYDAPMPYMQRITWSGSALHEGPLPGYPASHGCVRLTDSFAQLLWKTTKIGARVIVTRRRGRAGRDRPRAPVRAADRSAEATGRADRPRPRPPPRSTQPTASATALSAELIKTADATGKSATTNAGAGRARPAHSRTITQEPTKRPSRSGRRGSAPQALHRRGRGRHATFQPGNRGERHAATAARRSRSAAAEGDPLPRDASRAVGAQAERDCGRVFRDTTTDLIMVPERAARSVEPVLPATPAAPARAAGHRRSVLPVARTPPPIAPRGVKWREPISVFVSLKDGKLYVRQGMEPLFEMPVSFARPDQPSAPMSSPRWARSRRRHALDRGFDPERHQAAPRTPRLEQSGRKSRNEPARRQGRRRSRAGAERARRARPHHHAA